MLALRDTFQETVALGVRFGSVRVCIERVESQREVRWHGEIGRVDPLYVGATGKVLLAYLSPTELSKYLASVELKELTPRTITDRKTLERELTVVRERGYAVSDQDRSLGLSGLAAPIFLGSGEVGAALVIGGPTQRCTEEQLSAWSSAVVDAAGRIASRLGYAGARR
jgi:DNA-binding IclR family transcriptional regulator